MLLHHSRISRIDVLARVIFSSPAVLKCEALILAENQQTYPIQAWCVMAAQCSSASDDSCDRYDKSTNQSCKVVKYFQVYFIHQMGKHA